MWWLAVGGAAWLWGSFLNQLVDRLPPALPPGDRTGPAPTLWHPVRSVCLACGQPLAVGDNIPIVSYLLLRGRCRYCGVDIGRRTLVLEVTAPLVLLVVYGFLMGTGALWPCWGIVSAGLVSAARLAERRPLPRRWPLVLAGLSGWLAVALLRLGPDAAGG